MITQTEKTTIEEYLEFELNSDERHGYINGNIVLITGGTPDHNELSIALATFLRSGLRGQPYRVFATDQRLWIPEPSLYVYPDVMVLERPIQLQPGRTDTVINPCFIAEVLSKSTQNHDRSEKFLAYRSIESFREYLLIDQYKIQIEHYVKTAANQWLLTLYNDPNAVLTLNAFDVQISIAELYENVESIT
ncbi:Uma2 family endonuclease [Pseudanabaenaceae cyanobacterium LEGE 13415]|nr:Uma2 family endonuclease [Pseudanabaenaceae cyanobacterium LEGE 13415]